MIRYKSLASAAGLALTASIVSAGSASASTLGTRELVTWDGEGNNMCLDATSDSTHNAAKPGDPIQMWTCDGGPNQKWTFSASSGQYGTIKNGFAGLCLDAVTGATTADDNGDPVQLWTCNGGPQQKWLPNVQFDINGTQYVTLINEYSGTNVLDARNDASWNPLEDHDPVQIWQPVGGTGTDGVGSANQDWAIENY